MSYLINNNRQQIKNGVELFGFQYNRRQLYDKDKNAVAVYHNNKKIGFVPKYYNKAILKRLAINTSYELIIKEINKKCNECIKITLNIGF